MPYEIQSNIPMPTGFYDSYPFSEMEVGDSFFVPHGNTTRIMSAARHLRINSNRKFKSRSLIENGVNGVRVWRVK